VAASAGWRSSRGNGWRWLNSRRNGWRLSNENIFGWRVGNECWRKQLSMKYINENQCINGKNINQRKSITAAGGVSRRLAAGGAAAQS